MASRPPNAGPPGRRAGFTLTELLTVMTIIGIILIFILIAAQDSRRRAEEAATLSLITKLETGITDRLDALLQTRPEPSFGHDLLARIYPNGNLPTSMVSPHRAQVIAWFDYIKRELPDVFFIQNLTPGSQDYPINFAANPFPDPNGTSPIQNFVLPLAGGSIFLPSINDFAFSPGEGVYGASYTAAAGLYKNLGFAPAGYDGVDNNGDGLIDEFGEGGNATVRTNLAAHKHRTARSEMLYAILVECAGPLGSIFSRDDFTEREVKDTDGDGLPEFVDAWGEPLQFFRWPLLYNSQAQRGQRIADDPSTGLPTLFPPYDSVFEAREQDPLDPNQQLMAPSWWFESINQNYLGFNGPASGLGASGGVMGFESLFHRLSEPLAGAGGVNYWDRSGTTPFGPRRAFLTRPLILSGGPDKQLGVFLYAHDDLYDPSLTPAQRATGLIANENNAMGFVTDLTSSYTIAQPATIALDSTSYDMQALTSAALREAAKDDISNQNGGATAGLGGP